MPYQSLTPSQSIRPYLSQLTDDLTAWEAVLKDMEGHFPTQPVDDEPVDDMLNTGAAEEESVDEPEVEAMAAKITEEMNDLGDEGDEEDVDIPQTL